MGFAASQARLLLLTARKSDLEFRAQQITNAEMALARQTEEIATEYARKLSNQTMKYQVAGLDKPQEMTIDLLIQHGLKIQKCATVNGETTWSDVDTTADANNLPTTAAELMQGINNGQYRIVCGDFGTEGSSNKIFNPDSETDFIVCYDTSDDAQADADYRSKTAALQVKEKRLQMELQQVEAQQKACDAEIESVKKIMDKHIDKAFKVFS